MAPLGAGGMGEVYRAKDPRLGREVAIKVVPDLLSGEPEVRARFEREARARERSTTRTSARCTTSAARATSHIS